MRTTKLVAIPLRNRYPSEVGIRCPESTKATFLLNPPQRRIRCVVCNRLVRLRVARNGQVVVVPPHDFPRLGTNAAKNVLKRLVG